MEALFTCGGVLLICVASLFRRGEARRQDVLTALLFSLFIALGAFLHLLLERYCASTLDPQFLAMDRALGFDPIAVSARLWRHPVLIYVLRFVYMTVPITIGVAWVAEQNHVMRAACLLGGIACFPFYMLFPAVGPAFYNWHLQTALAAPRNCMPSMHLTWTILLAWNARHKWLRSGLWLYAALTAVATIAAGEPYLIDLLAAIPYSTAIQYAALRLVGKRAPALARAAETS